MKRAPISAKTRFDILRRDNFTCQYCGARAPHVELHVDHVEAVARGGRNDKTNLATACRECNLGKGASGGSAPLHVVVTAYAQELLDLAQAKFRREVRPVELFPVIRRYLELMAHDVMWAADHSWTILDEAETYDDFVAVQREQITSALDLIEYDRERLQ